MKIITIYHFCRCFLSRYIDKNSVIIKYKIKTQNPPNLLFYLNKKVIKIPLSFDTKDEKNQPLWVALERNGVIKWSPHKKYTDINNNNKKNSLGRKIIRTQKNQINNRRPNIIRLKNHSAKNEFQPNNNRWKDDHWLFHKATKIRIDFDVLKGI